jgi:hypothetical protein
VGQYRSAVSGGEGEHLLEREVTTLSIESRKQLLEKVGITLTITEQQDDELWVKIGGDAGGGTFKMNFQIVTLLTLTLTWFCTLSADLQ